jgi:hypothetical protein
MGTPSVTPGQVAKRIQRGWEQTGEVHLNDDEKRVLVQTLNRRGPGGPETEALRSLQQSMGRSLGEDVY